MSERSRQIGILFLLGCSFFLGNWMMPVTDPVEVNYAQTAVEMLQSGDWVSPRIYGHFWYDKPVFFYWELIAAFSIFGIADFAARFFPPLFAMAGLFLAYFFAGKLYGRRTGFWSAVILGTSLIYWCLAKLIITDMTLFFFMNGTLACFFLAYRGTNKWMYYPAYFLAGLSVLTKGPVGLALPGLIILLFLLWDKNLGELKRMKIFSGMVLFLLVCVPWYYQMYLLHGSDFLDTFLGVHNYLRATVSEHPKWDVWYYYAAILFLGIFPWSLHFPWGFWKWKKEGRCIISSDMKFLLLWTFVIIGFFQCMATKYPTYTFPSFFPIAVLLARIYENNEKVLHRMAFAGVIFSLAVMGFLVTGGQGNGHFAGKYIAETLSERIKDNDLLVTFGDYRASVVYYTQHPMYSLDSAESIEKRREKVMDWSAKNVMPFLAYEDIPVDKDVYLVVEDHRAKEFDRYFQKEEWQLLAKATPSDEIMWLYYRPAKTE